MNIPMINFRKTGLALLSFTFLLIGIAHAQSPENTSQVIFFKDGSFVKGEVLELKAGENLLVRRADGELVSYSASSVSRIKSSMKGFRQFTPRASGFVNTTTVGLLFHKPADYIPLQANPGLEIINGYQFPFGLQAGLGVSVDLMESGVIFPVFGDFRYTILKGKSSPYLGLKAGYSIAVGKKDNNQYYDFAPQPKSRNFGGPLAGLEAGYKIYTGERFGITAGLEYRFQMLKSNYDGYFYNNGIATFAPVTQTTLTHRIGLKVGVFFH